MAPEGGRRDRCAPRGADIRGADFLDFGGAGAAAVIETIGIAAFLPLRGADHAVAGGADCPADFPNWVLSISGPGHRSGSARAGGRGTLPPGVVAIANVAPAGATAAAGARRRKVAVAARTIARGRAIQAREIRIVVGGAMAALSRKRPFAPGARPAGRRPIRAAHRERPRDHQHALHHSQHRGPRIRAKVSIRCSPVDQRDRLSDARSAGTLWKDRHLIRSARLGGRDISTAVVSRAMSAQVLAC